MNKGWIHWNTPPSEIIKNTVNVINYCKEFIKKTKNIYISSNNILNILNRHNIFLKIINNLQNCLEFIRSISDNKDTKISCYKSEDLLSEFINNIDIDYDYYIIFKKINDNFKKYINNIDLDFLKKIITNFKKNGVEMKNNEDFKKINDSIKNIENKCQYDILTWNEIINDINYKLPKQLEKLNVNIKNKSYIKLNINNFYCLIKYIKDPSIRRLLENRYFSKCENNIKLFIQLLCLRHKKAKILGYNNYIDMCTNSNGYSDKIKSLLDNLINSTQEYYDNEISFLKTINNNNNINSYDIDYLITEWKKEYKITDSDFGCNFPLDNTIKKILNVYEKYFNLKFIKTQDINWNNQVESYEIRDNENKLLGIFYLDLISRKNKINIPKVFIMNSHNIPITCILMSISDKKYILYTDIILLIRSIAQIIMIIYNKTKYIIFDGEFSETKFTDIFSRIYEKICWDEKFIKKISSNHISSKKIKKIIKMKKLGGSIKIRRNILDAYFDIMMHSSDKFINLFENILEKNDNIYIENAIKDIYHKLYKKILNGINYNIGCFKPVGWSESYTSLYFGTILSEIYASNIYAKKIKNNIKNKNIHTDIINNIVKYSPYTDILNRTEKFLNNDIDNKYYINMNIKKININNIINKLEKSITESENNFSEHNKDTDVLYSVDNTITDDYKIIPNTKSIFIKSE